MWLVFVFLEGLLEQRQSKRWLILRESRTRAKNMLVKQEGLKLDCRRHFLTRKRSPEVRQSFQ